MGGPLSLQDGAFVATYIGNTGIVKAKAPQTVLYQDQDLAMAHVIATRRLAFHDKAGSHTVVPSEQPQPIPGSFSRSPLLQIGRGIRMGSRGVETAAGPSGRGGV